MNGRERKGPPPGPGPTGRDRSVPASGESGWLADLVYTGERFEAGLAFFVDAAGRLTRFSREPADLAGARRLSGQAALPGMVNGHSQVLARLLRGRGPGAAVPAGLTGEDIYDTARMAFMEMLLAGMTCVGEFHLPPPRPDGRAWPQPNAGSHELLRAARDVGIRLALFKVAATAGPASACTPTADQYLRDLQALADDVARTAPGDGSWLGVAPLRVDAVPPDYLKAIAAHAHAQRLRLHVPLGDCEDGPTGARRRPVALLAEAGLVDKRLTAIHGGALGDDEVRLLGAARALLCACPSSARPAHRQLPAARLLGAQVGIALGSGRQVQIDLLEEARLLGDRLEVDESATGKGNASLAAALFQAASATGARSLGAPSGALEVGRPADFFTVNLFDPSLAGATAETLLATIIFSLQRRAIREVWVGGRQVVANGRHAFHGPIVGRFVELQRRLWAGGGAA